MENWFSVSFGKRTVGKVRVTKQGLYYHIVCRCRIDGDTVCRLMVSCGVRHEKLGVVVPVEGGFGLDTKLPVKRLGEGEMQFYLLPKHDMKDVKAVDVYPEEPFAYISQLKKAYLLKRNGEQQIAFR